MNIKRGTVQTENFSMPWFSFGQGEKPVVILPGLSVTSVVDAAAAVAQEYACLAEDFTVYVFDRRVELPEVYPIAAMAEDTAAAMRQLGLHDVYLFGASQGGMMALVIAIEHPELVKKLALGSTTAHMHPEQAAAANRWLELARAGDGEGLCLAFGEAVYPPAVFAQYREGLALLGRQLREDDLARFQILAADIPHFNVSDRLHELRCPVLAIGVYEDAVVDSDATMEIAEALDERKDFYLFLYNGYGHAAYDTAPDYRERLKKFFLL